MWCSHSDCWTHGVFPLRWLTPAPSLLLQKQLQHDEGQNSLMKKVFDTYMLFFQINQSTTTLRHVFTALRLFIQKVEPFLYIYLQIWDLFYYIFLADTRNYWVHHNCKVEHFCGLLTLKGRAPKVKQLCPIMEPFRTQLKEASF